MTDTQKFDIVMDTGKMRSNDFSTLTFKVQIGDLEIYTAPDMGFIGAFAVTPKIHSHPYYEIIAVIEGKLCIGLLDDEDIELEKGGLCIIPPKCYHSTCADGELPKMLAIRFSYSRVGGEGRIYDGFCSAVEQITEPTCFDIPENMPSALMELRQEMIKKDLGWEFMCRSLLEKLYIEIFRLLSCGRVSESIHIADDSKHSRYYHIEMWFARNFAKQITEGDLAREISLSERQLSRVFADIYGMSFREKLVEVRLHRAAQLLEQTELNIDKIAQAVGYRSFSGFHRAFVNYFGCTPFEYRKHNN